MNEFIDTLEKFRNKRIFVVGDAIIDHYIHGTTTSISPDAPVPLIEVHKEQHYPGAVKKVIQYILNLGGDVEVVSCVGNDFEGEQFKKELGDLNIGTKGVFTLGNITPTITRVISKDQQLLRLEKKYEFTKQNKEILNHSIVKFLSEKISRADSLLILDYDLGLLDPAGIVKILEIANENSKKTIVRPAASRFTLYRQVDVMQMSRDVAAAAVGINCINDTSLRIVGSKILSQTGVNCFYMPWIEDNSYYFEKNQVKVFSAPNNTIKKNFVNISSASISVIGLSVTAGLPYEKCAELAHVAGCLAARTSPDDIFGLDAFKKAVENY